MNEDTRQLILKWISDNHMHHAGADEEYYNDEECDDKDHPYVNSMDLERFIKSLPGDK